MANRGETFVDLFFGLKLHLVVNEHGELVNIMLAPSNVDDKKPVPDLATSLYRFTESGYYSR